MDFSWSKSQLVLKKSIIDFALKELKGDILEKNFMTECFRDRWRKCANFGVHGLAIPQEFGGKDLDILTSILMMEGLGYGCKDNGFIFGINAQMWGVQQPILKFGTKAQKENFLTKLVNGEFIGALGMTEPESGSDCFSLSTRAEKKGDVYILNGSKTFISNAPVADLFVIFATTKKSRGFMGITAFLVEKKTAGLSVSEPMEKMGLDSAPMGKIFLENCRVSKELCLGGEGKGSIIFKHAMEWERSCILASCIGTMERQVEACVKYAKIRHQFGKSIGKFSSVANRIIDMNIRLETARLLLYKTGWLQTQNKEATQEIAMTKLYLSECFVQSSLDAIQVHGGLGYIKECGIEMDLRDAIASRICSGTSEIQREIIAKLMGL